MKKYGFIQSPTDKTIERLRIALNILMGEDVPIEHTAFYVLIKKLHEIDADTLKTIVLLANTNTKQLAKTARILRFIAERIDPDEWDRFKAFSRIQEEEGD